jgi:Putative restriction endonuclease
MYYFYWVKSMQDLERKIELLGGSVVIGRHRVGVIGMLQLLLQSWKIKQILELADQTQWQLALAQLGAPEDQTQLEAWAEQQPMPTSSSFDLFDSQASDWWLHHKVLQKLRFGLLELEDNGLIESFGFGFVMRYLDDILMPDVYVGKPDPSRNHEYHYDGPAELMVEVLKSDSRDYDCSVQLAMYQKHQAAEIWLIDPSQQQIEVFSRQGNGSYQKRVETQVLESAVLPLRLNISSLFETENNNNPFENSLETQARARRHGQNPQLGWTWLKNLSITPEPQQVSLDAFMTFVPEVKFEGSNAKLEVGGGGWKTTKDLLQLLMYHLGLKRTLSLLPMPEWVTALATHRSRD